MAIPLAIGALLLAGGLAGKTVVENRRAKQLSNDTSTILRNAQAKQSELDEERQAMLGSVLEQAAVGKGQVESAQSEAEAKSRARMNANVNARDPGANDPGSAGLSGPAGRVLGAAVEREDAANSAENAAKLTAMAELDSLGDVFGANSRIFRPAQGEISANQRIAQGESARIPLALDKAQADAMGKYKLGEMLSQASIGVGSGVLAGGAFGAGAAAGTGAAGAGGTTAKTAALAASPTAYPLIY